MLDLRHLRQGPEFAEMGLLENLAALQRRLAWQTLQFVDPSSSPAESDFDAEWPLVRVDAIENYIRGLLATVPAQKEQFFSRAVRLDSDYSQACYQLGMLAYARQDYKAAAQWFQKVAPTDVHYRYALFHLGVCNFNDGDFQAAKTAFEKVADEVPLNEVFNNLGRGGVPPERPASSGQLQESVGGRSE